MGIVSHHDRPVRLGGRRDPDVVLRNRSSASSSAARIDAFPAERAMNALVSGRTLPATRIDPLTILDRPLHSGRVIGRDSPADGGELAARWSRRLERRHDLRHARKPFRRQMPDAFDEPADALTPRRRARPLLETQVDREPADGCDGGNRKAALRHGQSSHCWQIRRPDAR
jgi:hypothetical protein